jgi:hypothetical protein
VDQGRARQDRSGGRAAARVRPARRDAAEAGDDLGRPPRDDLYVRSAYGRTSAWFRSTRDRHEGRVRAGGVDKDVRFVDAAGDVADQIDAAYRTKYRHYAARFVTPMVSPEARATTIKLVPRAT